MKSNLVCKGESKPSNCLMRDEQDQDPNTTTTSTPVTKSFPIIEDSANVKQPNGLNDDVNQRFTHIDNNHTTDSKFSQELNDLNCSDENNSNKEFNPKSIGNAKLVNQINSNKTIENWIDESIKNGSIRRGSTNKYIVQQVKKQIKVKSCSTRASNRSLNKTIDEDIDSSSKPSQLCAEGIHNTTAKSELEPSEYSTDDAKKQNDDDDDENNNQAGNSSFGKKPLHYQNDDNDIEVKTSDVEKKAMNEKAIGNKKLKQMNIDTKPISPCQRLETIIRWISLFFIFLLLLALTYSLIRFLK